LVTSGPRRFARLRPDRKASAREGSFNLVIGLADTSMISFPVPGLIGEIWDDDRSDRRRGF
jgi:hypothetical protein